jgi:hypothetical protein
MSCCNPENADASESERCKLSLHIGAYCDLVRDPVAEGGTYVTSVTGPRQPRDRSASPWPARLRAGKREVAWDLGRRELVVR